MSSASRSPSPPSPMAPSERTGSVGLRVHGHDYGNIGLMKTIKASEFKATCLRLMDEVAETGDPVIITKNGRPVSKLVPYRKPLRSLWGLHAGSLELVDDLVDGTGAVWEADS